MAKQSVSPIERHLEKAVLAATAAVLLAVAFFYVIANPNAVDIHGEKVAPGLIDEKSREAAQQLAEKIRSAKPRLPDEDDGVPQAGDPSPLVAFGIAPELPISPVGLGLEPPPIKASGAAIFQVKLAEILPLGKPILRQGRAQAELKRPEPLLRDSGGPLEIAPGADFDGVKDVTWVSLFAKLDRKAQREAFRRARHTQTAVVVTGVDVERQELGQDGTWGAPTTVRAYRQVLSPTLPTIEWEREEEPDGTLKPKSAAFLDDLLKTAQSPTTQKKLLRPSLAEHLVDGEWMPPQSVDGVNASEFFEFSRREADKSAGTRDTSRLVPARALKDARKALAEQDYETARDLARAVASDRKVIARFAKEADAILSKAEQKLQERDRLLAAKTKRAELRKSGDGGTVGPDLDLIWAHDLTAVPGRTYRYRLRVDVYNHYAGNRRKLENRAEAERIVLAGDWSDWSDPIRIEPDTHVFFAGIDTRRNGPIFKVYHWTKGKWEKGRRVDAGPGEEILYRDGRSTMPTGYTVVDFEPKKPHRIREKRRGTITYRVEATEAVMLLTEFGHLEERLYAVDRRSPVEKSIREKMQRAAKAERSVDRR